MKTKRLVDICLMIFLLFLMAYQVTGEVLHEWIGIGMTLLVICHQILNRKWYAALFRGKYNLYRTVTAVNNFLLLASFAMTAFCGMAMSGYAVPFFYGMTKISFARRFHLALSHWAFVLMGTHLGLHLPAMAAKLKLSEAVRNILTGIFICIAGYGAFLFIRSDIPEYMFFKNAFAFLDYMKPGWQIILENLLKLLFWVFIGVQIAELCRLRSGKHGVLQPFLCILAAAVITLILLHVIPDPALMPYEGSSLS